MNAFDAVLFDLDGTLVATELFWPEAARVGALRAFAELELERDLPSSSDWMSMVGLSLATGFENVFPDLEPAQRAHVMGRCVEEETRALRERRAALLPGVQDVLEQLRASGVRTGIASNCSQAYLDAMMNDLGLAQWIEEGRCLDTRGIHDKAGMIEDLLLTLGTRSAVMVGDRAGDRDAAWANGLPHVHLARGYAQSGEDVQAEATIEGFDQLLERLSARSAGVVDTLGCLELPAGPLVVGVTGGPASGKTLFARDLATEIERSGRSVVRAALEDFALEGHVLDPLRLAETVDLSALERLLAEPDPDGALAPPVALVLEGPGLLHPLLASRLTRSVALCADEEVALRRIAGRDGRHAGPAPVLAARSERLPAQAAFEARYPARERADVVIDTTNLLLPLRRTPVPAKVSGSLLLGRFGPSGSREPWDLPRTCITSRRHR